MNAEIVVCYATRAATKAALRLRGWLGTDKLTVCGMEKRVFGAADDPNQNCSGRCRRVMGQYAPE
jgi:hypothetical protein